MDTMTTTIMTADKVNVSGHLVRVDAPCMPLSAPLPQTTVRWQGFFGPNVSKYGQQTVNIVLQCFDCHLLFVSDFVFAFLNTFERTF